MIHVLLVALVCAGCVSDLEPRPYSCVVVYRCSGADTMGARAALTCAESVDEADGLVTDAMIEAMPEACPGGWGHVRPLCFAYVPATECRDEDR